jgi:NTP pyrophosphatase (non-canonical NTP hydrolase)
MAPTADPVPADSLSDLAQRLRQFAAEREWEQFHSPKNLAAALTVEAAELLEHFQWMTEPESRELDAQRRGEVALEIADVLLYLVRLADVLGIDPVQSAREKMRLNAQRYPIERARGSSRKFDRS